MEIWVIFPVVSLSSGKSKKQKVLVMMKERLAHIDAGGILKSIGLVHSLFVGVYVSFASHANKNFK